MITWKDLEMFMSDMTEEQKNQRVVLIDYVTDIITTINAAVLVEESVYYIYNRLISESDTGNYSPAEYDKFIEDIDDSVYEGEIALII